jgi:RHS repeat-associated protein
MVLVIAAARKAKKKFPSGWVYFSGLFPALTNRGFTGHEHIDEMGLIHMNGRVYDPQIGRFLSTDPVFIEPDSQPGLYCILPLVPIFPPLSPPIPINKAAPSPAPWFNLHITHRVTTDTAIQ